MIPLMRYSRTLYGAHGQSWSLNRSDDLKTALCRFNGCYYIPHMLAWCVEQPRKFRIVSELCSSDSGSESSKSTRLWRHLFAVDYAPRNGLVSLDKVSAGIERRRLTRHLQQQPDLPCTFLRFAQ